jgi:hypothetical protein
MAMLLLVTLFVLALLAGVTALSYWIDKKADLQDRGGGR